MWNTNDSATVPRKVSAETPGIVLKHALGYNSLECQNQKLNYLRALAYPHWRTASRSQRHKNSEGVALSTACLQIQAFLHLEGDQRMFPDHGRE